MDEIEVPYGKYDMTNDSHLSFACSCGADAKAWCATVRKWATDYLKTDDAGLLNKAVYKMNWEYWTEITGIPNDMWSAVDVEIFDRNNEDEATRVEHMCTTCDDVLDGIAFTVRRLYNRFGDSRKYVEEDV